MNRKDTTSFLLNTLIQDRLTDRKYYAREVTLDYGTSHPKRIDVMQFLINPFRVISEREN